RRTLKQRKSSRARSTSKHSYPHPIQASHRTVNGSGSGKALYRSREGQTAKRKRRTTTPTQTVSRSQRSFTISTTRTSAEYLSRCFRKISLESWARFSAIARCFRHRVLNQG